METFDELLELQCGVISRRQALARGVGKHDLARLVRRRELTVVHPGVYIDHTGELTWMQRAWAAVLFSWPAALSHQSALRAADGPGRRSYDDSVIQVAVDRGRHVTAPNGVRVHRLTGVDDRVQWNLSPPRVRYDDATIEMAAAAETEMECIAVLAEACQSRRTTARRLLAAATARNRLPRRDWIIGVLGDIAEGACSVLEQGYLSRVERPHGLPAATRQARDTAGGGTVYRDVEYDVGVIVELDGRLFHDNARDRDADFDRDLDAATSGRQTIRLSYGQVFDRGCRTAERVAALLAARGWAEVPHACSPGCTVGAAAA